MVVALDGTALLSAQPALAAEFGAGVGAVQWTSTAYLLAVASLLVLAGRLGDRYGHGRLLGLGLLGFGATSAGIGLAPSIGWVIALRAAQGVSGALLQPATLALLQLSRPPAALPRAVAVRTAGIGLAAGAGPLLGGLLVAWAGWRAVFLVNVPLTLGLAVLALGATERRAVRPSGARREPVGWGGGLLTAATLAALVHALTGWSWWSGGLTVVGAAALVGYQRRAVRPVVPGAVLRSRVVLAGTGLLLATGGGLFGSLFLGTFLLQRVRGMGALTAGLQVLPLTVLMVLGSPVAATALRRYGPRRTAVAGVGLVALGVLGLARSGPTGGPVLLGAVFAVLGAGFATVMVTATGAVVAEAPPGYAGVVGGLKQTAMNVGPTLGIAATAGVCLLAGPGAVRPPLLAAAALAALGLLPAALLPGRPAARPAGAETGGTVQKAEPSRA
ncbi:MFS transporter [Kitasatospora sp. MMS16-BH015]|uniref:MFS transporter n=1 Tax=Kitasatospora sp. MMS16-BH015 TaxID=2018025 RepID=UPI000CA27179|nr:MFS transporter [Kitasatospora sp. MMS16-BH015]AUG75057.1 MFS transporter [Kitasatospora sp. MMS16-BH015]